MTKTKEHAVSRRTFVKGSALAGLGAAALGTGTLFACSPQGTDEVSGGASETVDEKVVWGHCSVNDYSRRFLPPIALMLPPSFNKVAA